MPSPEKLENLERTGEFHAEPPSEAEHHGLVGFAEARLQDARNETLSLESRFDLAYNAAHALALAALRWHGYRSKNRYLVFQVLPHTLDVATPVWRLLAKCHAVRNRAEYEGVVEVGERLVTDLVAAASEVEKAVRQLPPPPAGQ